MSEDIVVKEYSDNDSWYKIYESGLLHIGKVVRLNSGTTNLSLPVKYADLSYETKVYNIAAYNPYQFYTKKKTYCYNTYPIKTNLIGMSFERKKDHSSQVYSVFDEWNEHFICPKNKTVYTLGTVIPKSVSFKGPTKTATVENISNDPSIGVGTGTLNEITLSLATNQFITLKVDIAGAKINNLPTGFVFSGNEIKGAAKNPGEYKFNIVSESTSIPVTMKVSNIIRIA